MTDLFDQAASRYKQENPEANKDPFQAPPATSFAAQNKASRERLKSGADVPSGSVLGMSQDPAWKAYLKNLGQAAGLPVSPDEVPGSLANSIGGGMYGPAYNSYNAVNTLIHQPNIEGFNRAFNPATKPMEQLGGILGSPGDPSAWASLAGTLTPSLALAAAPVPEPTPFTGKAFTQSGEQLGSMPKRWMDANPPPPSRIGYAVKSFLQEQKPFGIPLGKLFGEGYEGVNPKTPIVREKAIGPSEPWSQQPPAQSPETYSGPPPTTEAAYGNAPRQPSGELPLNPPSTASKMSSDPTRLEQRFEPGRSPFEIMGAANRPNLQPTAEPPTIGFTPTKLQELMSLIEGRMQHNEWIKAIGEHVSPNIVSAEDLTKAFARPTKSGGYGAGFKAGKDKPPKD